VCCCLWDWGLTLFCVDFFFCSVGLIKGVIDQVDQQLCATWVQPRVLDNAQMASMAARLGEWGNNVSTVLETVESSVEDSVFKEA
jgi:hypothetical protein